MTSITDRYNQIASDYNLRAWTSKMSEESKDLIMRVNCYIVDHPDDTIPQIVELIGPDIVTADRIAKWTQRGYVIRTTRGATKTTAMIKNKNSIQTEVKSPVVKKKLDDLEDQKKLRALGLGDVEVEDTGSVPTIEDLRIKIKQAINFKINDAQAVSQYSNALRALSGVQEIEKVEDFEENNSIKIYVPEIDEDEKSIEVDPVERL